MVVWEKGAGEGWIGNLRSADATIIYRMDKNQCPAIQQGELFSVFYILYIYITIFIYFIYIYIYIYIYLNHFAIQQKLTQHFKSTILQ